MEVKGTKVASIEDVINVLGEDKADPTYEQQLAMQHAKKFAITKAKSEKLKKELEGTGLLNERSVIKIIEIMPKNQMTLRQILAQEKKTFSDEDVNKILAMAKGKE
jgi:DNA-directed RNA polymerase subunit F